METISLDIAQLRSSTRVARVAACREALTRARESVAHAHRAGGSGVATTGMWSHAVDEVVRALYQAALTDDLPPLALIAVGGYGRAELCPGSDLDLWFVTPRPQDARVAALAESVLYPLWDLKLPVGHAVRSVEDSVALGREDLTAATALLDLRPLCGDTRLCDELARSARAQLCERPHELVRQLVDEQARRHARFGDTVFLLEPDVKNGEGAYRDLLVALWAAKARFGIRALPDLLTLGQATPRQVTALESAREFFLRVRTAAHLASGGRRQDRLSFEIQETIAPSLWTTIPSIPPPDDGALGGKVKQAVAPAVEALMRAYYLHAKAVAREGGRVVERCVEPPAKRPSVRRVDHAFVLWNGKLSTHGPEVFADSPSEMVRIFNVALELGVEIYGHTRELIAEACHRPETTARLAADPRAAVELCKLLVDDRDAHKPSLLEQAHDLGLLVALMPEFGPCTARVQHDLYHVYTVDQHSLYAVGKLKMIARGELHHELAVATQAMRDVERKLPLYLGTLLHDVGKPLGKGHSEKGARLAVAIAERLGLDDKDTALVDLLVTQHLTLAHLSQRRDVNDVAMVARLASDLGEEETLRSLYLLTIADMSMVAPGNMTAWKEQLLRELYLHTLAHLRRGPDLAGTDRSSLVARRKAKVAQLVDGNHELGAWYDGLPDRYFAQLAAPAIARHVAMSRRRASSGARAAVEAEHHPRSGWSELSVVADDTPGLLARIAGVLLANKVGVLSAQIASRKTGARGDEAIDVFTVRDRMGRALDDERVQAIATELERVLAGEVAVEELVADRLRRERSGLKPRVKPHVPTEVKIDNDVSADFSVVDVYTQDRPGVLYTITHTLADGGLDIGLSKVATEGDRVADVFYVRDGEGRKLSVDGAARLRESLGAALEALPLA